MRGSGTLGWTLTRRQLLSPLHVGIRLSSSTTPELKKIRADATRAKPQLPEATARQEINACSRLQQDDGQLGSLPDPGSVLTALCSHYVLERSTYPDITYTFLHQQFQELFAALHLKRNFSEMVTTGTGRTMLRDQRTARRPKP